MQTNKQKCLKLELIILLVEECHGVCFSFCGVGGACRCLLCLGQSKDNAEGYTPSTLCLQDERTGGAREHEQGGAAEPHDLDVAFGIG